MVKIAVGVTITTDDYKEIMASGVVKGVITEAEYLTATGLEYIV